MHYVIICISFLYIKPLALCALFIKNPGQLGSENEEKTGVPYPYHQDDNGVEGAEDGGIIVDFPDVIGKERLDDFIAEGSEKSSFQEGYVIELFRRHQPKKLNNISLLKGALFASFSYEIVKSLFSYYIREINDYTSIFGSLNTIVILMIWIWYTCFLFIFGAELAWVFYEKRAESKGLNIEK